jgi:hypothetical protein
VVKEITHILQAKKPAAGISASAIQNLIAKAF